MQEQRQVVRTIKLWYQFFVSTAYMGVPITCPELGVSATQTSIVVILFH